MTLDQFWDHIHKTRRKDPEAHADALTARLAKLLPAEIIDFDHWWGVLKRESYTWIVWGAAYIIGGGCSDDGFIDFRSWLILQGRDVFQKTVADPDSLADVKITHDTQCECYPAMDAWFAATGTERDDDGYAAWNAQCAAQYPTPKGKRKSPREDMGERWDFDDEDECRRRLPRLSAKYL